MPLSANKERFVRSVNRISRGSGLAADNTEYYEGQILAHNGSGRVVPAADTVGFRIAGICTRRLTTGASTTERIEFEWGHEEWLRRAAAVTAADIGANAMAADDEIVTDAATATNDVEVGMITELETKRGQIGAWVRIGEIHKDDA